MPVRFATRGLCPAVLFAFIRIGTSARAFAHPLTIQEASTLVQDWLEQPVAQLVETELRDIHQALALLVEAGTGGNLTTDAQLAAVSLRLGAVVHTVDTDYARFPRVRWFNPLTGGPRSSAVGKPNTPARLGPC